MRAQQRLSQSEIVLDQGRSGLQKSGVLRCCLDVARACLVRARRIPDHIEMVGEQAPGIRQIGLQLHRLPERGDCLRAAAS
jgi:hypothetical protein